MCVLRCTSCNRLSCTLLWLKILNAHEMHSKYHHLRCMQDMSRTKLQGRVLLPGNAVTLAHMGQELLLCVEGADVSADAAHGFMVGKDTAVHVLLYSESMPQPAQAEAPEVPSQSSALSPRQIIRARGHLAVHQ